MESGADERLRCVEIQCDRLEFLAAEEGAAESGGVGKLQVATDREAVGNPGHLEPQGLEQL